MAFAPLSSPVWSMGSPLERKKSPTSPVSPTQKPKPKPKPESPKQPAPARLPPPLLFQGPPSRNASNISLHLPSANAAAISLPASASTISPTSSPDHLQRMPSRRPADPKNSDLSPNGAGAKVREGPPTGTTDANTKHENDRADALWAEMQNTLAEVELSAANGSYIFGAGHAKALEELRTAQLALAKAWAKSEKDEVGSHVARDDAEEGNGGPRSAGAGVGTSGLGGKEKDGGKDGGKQGQEQPQLKQQPGLAAKKESDKERKKTLEEETENDILLAKTRREANDRYFEQVNNSVLDAVKKLDEVAAAMRKVEKESRDIWSEDGDGSETGSVTGSTTGG